MKVFPQRGRDLTYDERCEVTNSDILHELLEKFEGLHGTSLSTFKSTAGL